MINDDYWEVAACAIINELPISESDYLVGAIGLGGHYRAVGANSAEILMNG